MENGISLTKTQKARVEWAKNLGLRIGVDFEVGGDGLFIYAAEEYVDWQELAKKERREEIVEMVRVFGVGKPLEYDAETLSALNEDQILGMVNDHIGSAGEDEEIVGEIVAAQLEAMIEPLLIEALAQEEVVMEPATEVEEPIFVVTTNGVVLSKAFRKAIAEKTKELFGQADLGDDIPTLLQRLCLEKWGISRKTQRASFAVKLYSAAVVRSLEAQTRNGASLRVNSYWA